MKNAKIILPGGAGLVGQNLVAHLKRQGWHNLVVLDKHAANLEVLCQMHPGLTAVQADLAEDGDWSQHFVGADTVVMLQAQIGDLEPEPFVRNNITATEKVLAAMKRHAVPYLVHISSSVVKSVANDHYTNTKKQQEEIVRSSGVPCVILRPTLMFGWFDRKHLGWLARFMNKVPLFPIPGHGRYMRQPLYAADFSRIIVSCIQSRAHGQIYNISGLEQVDYIDIIRQIRLATRARTAIVKIPYALFRLLLQIWARFDKNPPFTADQLQALVAHDAFEVVDWPAIFDVQATPFSIAIHETFNDPEYSRVVLKF